MNLLELILVEFGTSKLLKDMTHMVQFSPVKTQERHDDSFLP